MILDKILPLWYLGLRRQVAACMDRWPETHEAMVTAVADDTSSESSDGEEEGVGQNPGVGQLGAELHPPPAGQGAGMGGVVASGGFHAVFDAEPEDEGVEEEVAIVMVFRGGRGRGRVRGRGRGGMRGRPWGRGGRGRGLGPAS